MDTSAIMGALWIIISGILVFFMQAGFTLVETGFTRSKNAGNIIMKNIMDLIVGSLGFWAIGYSVMYGSSISGFIGTPELFGLAGTKNFELFFQTVFAATAATIVSGAVAGRTKFSTYIIFSFIMTIIIYPIAGSWQWNGDGWLAQMGFIDFAGSSIVHAVGGWSALIGAILVGPRIGKYKDGVSQAIPGHNLLIGALGVMILWLGWFGFNGGSQLAFGSEEDVDAVGLVLINTNLAAAAGAAAALFYTWLRYGQPDISMTLNGALAGLVCITAGCGNVEPGAAAIMGMIAGVVVVISITFIDETLKIDDPVGAVSVHGVCGTLGTILLGVFSPDADILTQTIGAVSYMVWALVLAFIVFTILKVTIGLRVSEKEEIEGLDKAEHGIGVYNE
ncbi:ammonium transporter [Wenyingzhuangia sp. 2_MG-2023]|uniref:ammonium transporter n=1 Tax=Wenyingzhuangia sp. 2_MG-2023 TaxID=3062639 RepID=UPI0026E3BE83|nr:ammonium transporter [Wenyingzhuangia sp. 2_MG-2023]MDO6736938.1 ammonium transporter [Wenyingzhuangia sp. 2_MG-2023]MDO6801892.1 ammonium transporter [Wenyingzhuangia sp. 1_MG-2023]